MKQLKLKRIVFNQDFRKNARTLWEDHRRTTKSGDLKKSEVVAFVSCTGNQILFVLGDHTIKANPKTRYEIDRQLLDYRCWRIEGSCFNPYMLENYANSVGLSFGLKRLDEWFAER